MAVTHYLSIDTSDNIAWTPVANVVGTTIVLSINVATDSISWSQIQNVTAGSGWLVIDDSKIISWQQI